MPEQVNRMDRARLKQLGEYLTDINGARWDRAAALIETSQELADVLHRRIIDEHRTTGREPCLVNHCLAYR